MARRRSIRDALRGFLDTVTSRYSDFDGYWVLGLIVDEVREETIDLMANSNADAQPTPLAAFIRAGYEISFSARVDSDLGARYASKMSVFVAPHDAEIETRSARREPPRC